MNTSQTTRRDFLQGSAASLAFPLVSSGVAHAAPSTPAPSTNPRRLVIVSQGLGMFEEWFHPKQTGRNYEMPEVLRVLEEHREDFTTFSNINGLPGGHNSTQDVLTGVLRKNVASGADGGVSLDVRAAEHFATATRFPMLAFWSGGLSWNRHNLNAPHVATPRDAYRKLFTPMTPEDVTTARKQYQEGELILDAVRKNGEAIATKVPAEDREKLRTYFSSVGGMKERLKSLEKWADRPKPEGSAALLKQLEAASVNEKSVKAYEGWIDLIVLALQTDSTRVVTLPSKPCVFEMPGVTKGYHTLSHHGFQEERLRQLRIIETFHMQQLERLLSKLKASPQSDGTSLLDSTMVLFISGMGRGDTHSNQNLPIILAGGGFQHGQHLDLQGNQPLDNLYFSILRNLGVQTDHFSRSTGTLEGLV